MSEKLDELYRKRQEQFEMFEDLKKDIQKIESILREKNYEMNMITETIIQIDLEIEKVLDKV